MNSNPINIIFFDIGSTLGTVNTQGQALELDVFPGVEDVLKELGKKLRLGIVSRIAEYAPSVVDSMLKNAGL
ncbi:MAG TPA: hypothetical protein VEA37_01725, partial [Flavobacterium sp.]|nr:hypothetical protein [Flavobacterium sp.]